MDSRSASLLLLILLAVGAVGFFISYHPPERKPAELSFKPDFPTKMPGGTETKAYVDVSCSRGDAKDISLVISSEEFSASSDKKDLVRAGSTERITLTLFAKDVIDGNYSISIALQYTDDFGVNRTKPKSVYVFILPSVEFTDIKWKFDLLQPFGKNRISQNDETELYVRVRSRSRSMLKYTGLTIRASLSMVDINVSVRPNSLPVDPLGPSATSPSYTFKLESRKAVLGAYQLRLSLYSRDGVLVAETQVDFAVTV